MEYGFRFEHNKHLYSGQIIHEILLNQTKGLVVESSSFRSSILIEMNELSQALKTAEAGLKQNRSAYELHLTRATILRDTGEREEAKRAYRTALEIKSDFLLAIKRLAFMYSEDNQHDLALPL